MEVLDQIVSASFTFDLLKVSKQRTKETKCSEIVHNCWLAVENQTYNLLRHLVPHSQHSIFFITYESAQ